MSHTPHELTDEFPGAADRIQALKQDDSHFRKLCDAYHDVNRAIHRAETNTEPTSQAHEEDLRKERMRLKDQIASRLA